MPSSAFSFWDEIGVQLLVGFGFALFNVVVRYFAPSVPRFMSVLRWKNLRRALVAAYLIALVFQLVTSPFFVSAFQRVYVELAWSPFQAIFNVLGVIVIDLIVMAWDGARRGAQVGRQQIEAVKERAADQLDGLGARLPLSAEQRAAQEARRQAEQQAEAQADAERKRRVDERLKDY